MPKHSATSKNIDIEALRAIAILFVLVAHIDNLLPWVTPQLHYVNRYLDFWTGVDLFFCISGFIIAKSFIKDLPTQIGWREFCTLAIPFWVRRAWRLLPSAWFWLAFVLIASLIFNSGHFFGDPGRNFIYQVYAMLNVANIYGYYCNVAQSCGINQVYWSLSLEEQFYLAFPILLFIVPRKLWVYVFLAIFAIQFPMNRGGAISGFLRTDAIALGVALALWAEHQSHQLFEPTFLAKRWKAAIVAAFLVIALAALGSAFVTIVPPSTGLVAVVSSLLVFIASYDRGYIVGNGLLSRIAEYLGSRSYALYLTHIPAFLLAKEIYFRTMPTVRPFTSEDVVPLLTLGLGLLFAFTEFSYRAIENPLRRRGKAVANQLQERLSSASTDEERVGRTQTA